MVSFTGIHYDESYINPCKICGWHAPSFDKLYGGAAPPDIGYTTELLEMMKKAKYRISCFPNPISRHHGPTVAAYGETEQQCIDQWNELNPLLALKITQRDLDLFEEKILDKVKGLLND